MEKVSNAAGAKLHDLKRRKDFDEMILPARKVARTGAEREARRKSGRTPQQVDMERAVQRVCMVTHRAGGLSETRKRDVRAGKSKYQGSSVYSGDALRNSEILEGSFIVDQLGDGTPDSLGALGTTQCSSCGALKCCMIANMIL